MKRYMTRAIVLMIVAMLAACGGGGGDSTSDAGSPDSTHGSNPGSDSGSTPGNDTGSAPGNDAGGTPGNDGGSTPGGDGGTAPGNDGGAPLPSAGARVEESDPAVVLSAGWTKSDSRYGWSGGGAMQSASAGATASFKFSGTSVRWIGRRSKGSGIALVRVDDGPAVEVDLFSRPNEVRTNVITLYGLSDGEHTLTIEVIGRQNPDANSNVVVVDAFEVQPEILSHLQETDINVALSAAWVQDDSSVWSGGGVASLPDPPVGGARVTETAGEKATLKFRGTSVAWSGYRGPDGGIALVQLDGGPVTEVDTYSPTQKFQEVLFTATGLADANHTLTIEVTGRKNDASTAAKIVVDAFDVTTPGRRYQEYVTQPGMPYQQGDAWITYSGDWRERNVNRSWSEGVVSTTREAGARADFTFTGTSVSWIGCQKASIGRARIYLDGAFVAEISNFKSVPIENYQYTIFRRDGLTNGQHTLTIEAVGNGNIVIDAFDVHP
jgi:hypothetical protein